MVRRDGLALLVVASCILASRAEAQVTREREARVTGPRGRTIDRRVEVERGPGFYQRELQIQRPGGTFERGVTIQRAAPGFGGPGPRGGGWFGPPPPGPRSSSFFSFGLMAAPVVSVPLWQSASVVPVAPVAPVVVAQPGAVVAPQPGAAQASPLDPVALEAQRLQSHHASSRRDAALTLGRLGDSRAVPPLVYALKHDSSKDVKIAAATALGRLGGPEAATVLERCIIYEKKEEVREAASAALAGLRQREAQAAAAPVVPSAVRSQVSPSPKRASSGGTGVEVPRLSPWTPSSRVDSSVPSRPSSTETAAEPVLEGPAVDENGGGASPSDRTPPPPPTPVNPG